MKIIALKGPGDSGKSMTLNAVYQFMLLFGYRQEPGHHEELGNHDFYDCIDILVKDGVRVGICMMGDFDSNSEDVEKGYLIQDLLTRLEKSRCDIAICACNSDKTRGIASIKKRNGIFVNKTVVTKAHDERFVNYQDAEKIYKLI